MTNHPETHIILDGKKLGTYVSRVIKSMRNVRARMHVAAVSSLHHASEHGVSGPNHPLNLFYAALTSNEQQAFKQYIDRTFLVLGGIPVERLNDDDILIPEADIAAARKAGAWLGFKKDKGFFVKKGMAEVTAAFRALAQESLIHPDGENWVRFMDRNNVRELKRFTNDSLKKGLKSLIDSASGAKDNIDATDVDKSAVRTLLKAYETITGTRLDVTIDVEPEDVTPSSTPKGTNVTVIEGRVG